MKRQHWLVAVLVATLLAAWWATGLEDDAADAPRRPARKLPQKLRAADRSDLAGLALTRGRLAAGAEEDSEAPAPDLFRVGSFLPPQPKAPPVPRPVAPPLPFRYAGMLEEGGVTKVFLEDGDQIRVVRAGDVVDGRYRVTAVSRSRIDLIYLPLNETQSLATGAMP
mgnify:CR=1 FL=1